MVKLVLIGFWACLMTLASSYAATYWKSAQGKAASAEQVQNVEYRKTREFTVPRISDGAIQGYIIAQLSYSIDASVSKNQSAPLDAFLLDEAYRYIYSDDSIDFGTLKKYDFPKFKKTLIQNVNARLDSNLIKDVLIQEFTYMTKSDLKKQL
jgi:hypothetical protein